MALSGTYVFTLFCMSILRITEPSAMYNMLFRLSYTILVGFQKRALLPLPSWALPRSSSLPAMVLTTTFEVLASVAVALSARRSETIVVSVNFSLWHEVQTIVLTVRNRNSFMMIMVS